MTSDPAPQKKTREEKRAEAIQLVKERATEQGLYFFHDEQREPFATIAVQDHRETWAIRSQDFRLWVMQVLYDRLGGAPKAIVKDLIQDFEAHAICRGLMHPTHVRIAQQNEKTYVDLGNARWQVLEIDSEGWRLLDESPVKFRRPNGIAALPHPVKGASLRDVTQFLNIADQKSEVLLLAWLTFALTTGTPYPILALSGVQGSGKSTTTRVLRQLIDPSIAPVTTAPRSEDDIAIAACNSHLIALDNLSAVSEPLSDALCRIATGGGLRKRKLYTDDSEKILQYCRPLVINGIGELVGRPDLLDRALIIHVAPIPENQRRDERSFWTEFEDVRPKLFGAMLDIVHAGIHNIDSVFLPNAPRMADFARWGVATERAMGFDAGAFIAAYNDNREDAHGAALENSPIAKALYELLGAMDGNRYEGTALELLSRLRRFCEVAEGRTEIGELIRHPKFPRSAGALSVELARIEPNLKKLSITVQRGRNHHGRYLVLRRTERAKPRPQVVEAAA